MVAVFVVPFFPSPYSYSYTIESLTLGYRPRRRRCRHSLLRRVECMK